MNIDGLNVNAGLLQNALTAGMILSNVHDRHVIITTNAKWAHLVMSATETANLGINIRID